MSRIVPTQSVLGDRFEIVRRLGAGGYGEVFEAIDRRVGARVAVKRLWNAEPEAILGLKREFRIRQDIEHPNLVHVGELLEVDGDWLLTMEIIVGLPWLRYLRRNPASLAATTRQVASALLALHDADLVHCDVKPSNVLVTHAGRAVLLDLGLASPRASALDEGVANAAGTAWYMAPEQGVGAPFGAPADLYALGACMYEALCGSAPFEGQPLHVIFRKQREDPPAPSVLTGGLASELESLCLELLARDPARRPTAREVIVRLDAMASAGAGAHARASLNPSQKTPAMPFVGRAQELACMRDIHQACMHGEFASIVVESESGLGKTRLVEHFLDGCERLSVMVLSGRCFDRESVPYNAFDGVVDSLADALTLVASGHEASLVPERAAVLAKAFPVLGRVPGFDGEVDDDAVQEHVFQAATDLVRALASRHSLVVVVDDFQWSDDESQKLLHRVFVEGQPRNTLLVLTSRPAARCRGSVRATYAELQERPGTHVHIRLSPLEAFEATALVRGIVGEAARDEVVAQIVAEAGGEPLFLGELAHRVLTLEPHDASPSLEHVIAARVARLDDDCARVLRALALSPSPLPNSVVALAARLESTECRRRILALRSARLVRTDRVESVHHAEIFHDRLRGVIVGVLSAVEVRRIHASLADALRTSGVLGSEDVASHLLAAGCEQEAAYELVDAALRAAEGFAFDRAARLYAKAMVLGVPRAEEASSALLVALGNARLNEGQPALAAQAFFTASEMLQGEQAELLRARAMEAEAAAK